MPEFEPSLSADAAANGADGTRVLAPLEPAATRVAPTGALYLRIGRDLRVFHQSPIVIGSAADCGFVIDHPELPRHALRLHYGPGGVWIERLDPTNAARPGIPRRLAVPSDLHLARGLVLRIGTEPPAARTRRLPIAVLVGSVALLGIYRLAVTSQPPAHPAPMATPASRPTEAEVASSRRPEATPAARPEPVARAPKRASPAARPVAAPTADRPRRAPTAPATAAAGEADLRRLEQAEFWIARGLPHRARPLLSDLPADPALAARALALRAELRRQAEDLRVQARALASIDPDAARTLHRQAAALLFSDDPLHLVLERELP